MKCRRLVALSMVAAFVAPVAAHPQKHATLSEEEEDKVREAQDPGERIGVYLELEQARLSKFESGRAAATDPKYDYESYFSALLTQYIQLNDEMKDWIEGQYERGGDMRKGLKALLEQGPRQLDQLRAAQQNPDRYFSSYASSLQEAIDDPREAPSSASVGASIPSWTDEP